jgi:hypothetical protein
MIGAITMYKTGNQGFANLEKFLDSKEPGPQPSGCEFTQATACGYFVGR